MNELLLKLANSTTTREVTLDDEKVIAEYDKATNGIVANIVCVYAFSKSTMIYKQTQNLIERTTKQVELTKLRIKRRVSHGKISVVLDLLGDDNVVLHSENTDELLGFSDSQILERLNSVLVKK